MVAIICALAGCGESAAPPDGMAGVDLATGGGVDARADLATRDAGPIADLAMNPCPDNPFSSFAEVSIRFTGGRCKWTVAEAKAGIKIPYEVVVTKDVPGVYPSAQDAGRCGKPGPSGLIVFEKLSGNNQTYCLCDQGRCIPPAHVAMSIIGGVHPGSFDWGGLNWNGPSDTNNPKGAPFPPGDYTLLVNATGTYTTSGMEQPFVVRDSMTITLTP